MLTKTKAKKILHDKKVHGKPLTDKQRKFFAAQAYQTGGDIASVIGGLAPALSLIPGLQAVGPAAGALSALMQFMPKKPQVIGGSPGNYQTGGPFKEPKSGDKFTTGASQFDYTTRDPYSPLRSDTTYPRGIEWSGRVVLSKGSRGKEVAELQSFLKSKGMYTGEVDSIFGPKTEAAVKKYQEWFNKNAKHDVAYLEDYISYPAKLVGTKNKIAVDGIVGDATRAALMYREMPPVKLSKKKPEEPTDYSKIGKQSISWNAEDQIANAGPVGMNYPVGAALLAAALLPAAAGELTSAYGASALESSMSNALRNGVSRLPSSPPLPKGGLPTTPNSLPTSIPRGVSGSPRAFQPRTPSSYGTRVNYQMGGDIPLSQSAFQVKGKPSVTDGNTYLDTSGIIKLDHDEVVKDRFVYSEDLKDPKTNLSFALQAKLIEGSTGKAQKALRRNPLDSEARNTIMINEGRSKNLAMTQEILANQLGLRTPGKSFQTGGPFPPDVYSPHIKGWYGEKPQYDLSSMSNQFQADRSGILTDPNTGARFTRLDNGYYNLISFPARPRTKVDTSHLPVSDELIAAGMPYNPTQSAPQLPSVSPLPNATTSPSTTSRTRPAARQVAATPRIPSSVEPEPLPGPGSNATYNPLYGTGPMSWGTIMPTIPTGVRQDIPYQGLKSPSFEERYGKSDLSSLRKPTTLEKGSGRMSSRFTTGDAFQAVEVGSKFLQLLGGPERDTANLDLTQINRQAYDVRPQLQRNQQNFANRASSIDTSSANLRRAIENQLYAEKLAADQQVITQYDQMNRQSQTQYEQQLSNQARFNAQQNAYTQNINAANRGQYQNAIQNAFTSLGNFGESLGRRKQSYDTLAILREMYPDVYGRIQTSLNNGIK